MSAEPVAPGTLVKPSHGRGLLRRGSLPGQSVAGIGRPPSAIRARLRGSFDERVAVLEEIADDLKQSAADRIRAVDTLAKYTGLNGDRGMTADDAQAFSRALYRATWEAVQAIPELDADRQVAVFSDIRRRFFSELQAQGMTA